MLRDLTEQGFCCGKHRVAAIMRKYGIHSRIKRKFKRTTDSAHSNPIAPNILRQNFSVEAPNKIYVTDITYVRTAEGWLYLAAVFRFIFPDGVGWSTGSRSFGKELVTEALQGRSKRRKPEKGLICPF